MRLQQPTRGFSLRLACANRNGARSFAETQTQRAGPALPSYLVLHHAGFAMPAPLLAPRWALAPPFHPYLRANHEDIPKVFLRAITGCRTAGGIFSVALSVNRYDARLGRRPLQQLPWRYQARCPSPREPQARWVHPRAAASKLFLHSREVVSGLSSRPARLREPGQRSSSSPANSIISQAKQLNSPYQLGFVTRLLSISVGDALPKRPRIPTSDARRQAEASRQC